jgi:tight adherence protein B
VTLLAALAVGVFCYLLTGAITGRTPRVVSWRRPRPAVNAQQLWLTQAGVRVTPWQFWFMSFLLGSAAFVVAWLVTRTPLIALVPAAVVALLPRAFYAQRRATRLQAVQEAWPDGLRDLVASIAAGRSLTQALISLASSGPAPLRVALARFPALSRMLGTAGALEVVKEELADPTSDRVLEILVLAHERGGQIVKEILEDLVVVTTKDLKVLDEIETEGLEMKINARAVLVLPWFVLLALTMRAGPFREFYQSAAGLAVVVVGAGLSVLGYAWISRLGRVHNEQRVFGSGGVRSGGTS